MAQLLEGMRVLDLGRNVAAPYAAKLLADYGADVIKVEHPAGDPARRAGPFFHDEPNPETSALFLHLNTNKRGITLDLSTREGQRILRRLAADADTIVEDFAPGQMEAWGIGYDALAADHPELVLASITPFGQSGPYRDYRGSEITLQALGGSLHSNGSAARYPVKLGGHAAHYYAGTAAALGMMLACYRVDSGDRGDWIDLAVYETQAGSMDRRRYFLTVAAYTGYPARRPSPGTHVISGVRPTRDGYVNVAGMHRPEALLRLIGREDLLGPEGLQRSAFPESDAPSWTRSRPPSSGGCFSAASERSWTRCRSAASSRGCCRRPRTCWRTSTTAAAGCGRRWTIPRPGRLSTPAVSSSSARRRRRRPRALRCSPSTPPRCSWTNSARTSG